VLQKQSHKGSFLNKKKHWTALLAVNGIGRKTLQKVEKVLNKTQISWEEFWVGGGGIWKACGLSEKKQESVKKFKKEHIVASYWESLLERRISVVSYKDKIYPQHLQNIEDKPPILFVKSKVDYYWNQLPIAVVGTRKVTPYGELVTRKISRELVNYDATIVSGFMYGVDLIAHQTAIENEGKTVAVLGFGFDYMFPRSHQKIFVQMLEKGAIFVSEFAPHISPRMGNFPVRNRIIAGMSLATVVTEAATKSGSLITANLAADYGRDVFTVPGPITSPYSEGTRALVNDGAMLVGSGGEVIQELSNSYGRMKNTKVLCKKDKVKEVNKVNSEGRDGALGQKILFEQFKKNSLEAKIINKIQGNDSSTDSLAETLNVDIARLSSILSMMEIQGLVKKREELWVSCVD